MIELPGSFLRGDANDSDSLALDDAIATLSYLFLMGSLACEDGADFDDDGVLGLPDAIGLLMYLFAAGTPPAYPFPLPGGDLTADPLGCG